MRGLSKVLVIAALLLLGTAVVGAQGVKDDLQVTIEPVAPSEANPEVGSLLRFTMKNQSGDDLYLVAYETPLRGLERNLLRIEHEGELVPYRGPLVRRVGPTAKDWLLIKRGQSVSVVLDISKSYGVPADQQYSVEYQSLQHVVPAAAFSEQMVFDTSKGAGGQPGGFSLPVAPVLISSRPAWVALRGSALQPDARRPELDQPDKAVTSGQAKAPGNIYYGCTTSQQSMLYDAMVDGKSQAFWAYSYLGTHGVDDFYYDWFGLPVFASTVYDNFYRTQSALNGGLTFHCDCTDPNVYAYTYADTYKEMWICGYFWNVNGQEQANTVVHEATHWSVVAGTEDWVYGYSACLALAAAPLGYLRAFDNADSYAYASQEAPVPQPLSVYITRAGTWNPPQVVTAHASGGTPPYTSYAWYRRPVCSGDLIDKAATTKDVPCDAWYGPFTTTPPEQWTPYQGPNQNIKVVVTDSVGSTVTAYSWAN